MDSVRCRSDKSQSCGLAGAGKVGVFTEKTVAGVYRLSAAAVGRGQNIVSHQVGFMHRAGADQHGFVGHLHMRGQGVGLGVHGDGAVTLGAGRANYPTGDFTAVGYQ